MDTQTDLFDESVLLGDLANLVDGHHGQEHHGEDDQVDQEADEQLLECQLLLELLLVLRGGFLQMLALFI
jgi:hypothetical protein